MRWLRRAAARLAPAGLLALVVAVWTGRRRLRREVADALMQPAPLPDIVEGAAAAPATIVEYASMTCSHCAAFHEKVWPALKAKYLDTGKAKFILREFPLDPLADRGVHGGALRRARQARRDGRPPVCDRRSGLSTTSRSSGCDGDGPVARRFPRLREGQVAVRRGQRRRAIPPPSDSASIRRRHSSSMAAGSMASRRCRTSTRRSRRRRNSPVSHRFLRPPGLDRGGALWRLAAALGVG